LSASSSLLLSLLLYPLYLRAHFGGFQRLDALPCWRSVSAWMSSLLWRAASWVPAALAAAPLPKNGPCQLRLKSLSLPLLVLLLVLLWWPPSLLPGAAGCSLLPLAALLLPEWLPLAVVAVTNSFFSFLATAFAALAARRL
jgi:hypothetical protein